MLAHKAAAGLQGSPRMVDYPDCAPYFKKCCHITAHKFMVTAGGPVDGFCVSERRRVIREDTTPKGLVCLYLERVERPKSAMFVGNVLFVL